MTKLVKAFNCLRLLRNPDVLHSTRSFHFPLSTQATSICQKQSFSTSLTCKFLKERTNTIVQSIRCMGGLPTELKEIEDRVMYNLRLYDKIDQDKLVLGAHFMKDLGLDSLDHVEIIMQMENEFTHYIPDGHAAKLLTPQELIDYMADQLDVYE